MISFRFHLVSIVAVFLGIAIGVVVGSTFVDRAIVDGLQDRIDTVEENLDQRRAENDQLQSENGRLADALAAATPFAVSGRLDGQAVLVLAVRGVDEDTVDRLVELARQAGAEAPGILWVEPSWALADRDEAAQLAELAGIAGRDPARTRSRAWAALVAELQAPPVPDPPEGEAAGSADDGTADPAGGEVDPTTTTEPEPPGTAVLDALVDSPFLSFETVGDGGGAAVLAGRSPSVIAVTGTRAEPELVPLLAPMVAALVDAGLPTAVGEIFVEPDDDDADRPERGDALRRAVSEELLASVSTADHLDHPEGLVALVLAVADLRQDVVGRYGYGDGAAGPLPTWTVLTPVG